MFKQIKKIIISGKECLPIIEGGKGIGLSTGVTAGHFAKEGAVGTISGVNPDIIDDNGKILPLIFKGKSRIERQIEMIEQSIRGIISQAKVAKEISGGKGRIHLNILWEMGGAEKILEGALAKTKDLIHGVTCGAGMPYKLAEISAKYKVYYYPIVSSMRAFRILWVRSFHKFSDWLGGVVYECPWRAGGHNGLSNAENPDIFGDSYERVKELRTYMNEIGLDKTPIIIAGGVWNLEEYESWIDNPEIGPIAFQFGTRPILTKESPAPDKLKKVLLDLKEEDIIRNRFSPTGFYSSAVKNEFLEELFERSHRQVKYVVEKNEVFDTEIICGKSEKKYYIEAKDRENVNEWVESGYTEALRTPDGGLVFVSFEKAEEMKENQKKCIGCLSQCLFSSWSQYMPEKGYNTGKLPDPRSFCIQRTLQNIRKGIGRVQDNLMFAGSNAYRFATDPFYNNGFIPTTKQLIARIMEGK
ncbi:NAD(P)H-dependent flavin oxidoreductase [Pseudomonadota bacterium]